MVPSSNNLDVYLEIGKKRTFACAVGWPGWCRIGRDVESALRALYDSAPRYAGIIHATGVDFQPPDDVSTFEVVDQLEGNSTTDFGAPGVIPSSDRLPFDTSQQQRYVTLLRAYWRAFDAAVDAAGGRELRKGPRGGGREVEGIVRHVLGADGGYLASLGWKHKISDDEELSVALSRTRQAILSALEAATRGELPERGPRGGVMWPARYFVRRVAWHVLDHAWEIEDRLT